MQRIPALAPDAATGKAKQLLDGVQASFGMTPNLMRTLANAPAALESYITLNTILGAGQLDAKFREQIALAVSQTSTCEYCIAAHSALGEAKGLSAAEVRASRSAEAADPKQAAGLRFAQTVVLERGMVPDEALATVRSAGYNDAEITEIVANVIASLFGIYFDHVAQVVVDFPRVA